MSSGWILEPEGRYIIQPVREASFIRNWSRTSEWCVSLLSNFFPFPLWITGPAELVYCIDNNLSKAVDFAFVALQNERAAYEVIVEDGRLMYRQSGVLVNTTEDSKWIFVLSTTRSLYVGQVFFSASRWYSFCMYEYEPMTVTHIWRMIPKVFFVRTLTSRRRRVNFSIQVS